MTDLPAPPPYLESQNGQWTQREAWAPRAGVARYGVSFVGPTFEWAYMEPDPKSETGELVQRVKTFRAHPGLSFDDQIAYTRSLSILQASAAVEQRRLEKVIEQIAAMTDDDEVEAALTKLADDTVKSERDRWAMQVDQVCMLVAPADRDEFREVISHGNSADVRDLKAYLVDVVVTRTQKQVEVAATVDPTSQPSSSG